MSNRRKVFPLAMLVAVAAVALVIAWKASQPAPPSPPPTPGPRISSVPLPVEQSQTASRIAIHDARQWIDAGRVLVLDVRGVDDYVAGHIPGALHIPLSRLEGELPYLPKDRSILTYCT